MKRRRQLNGRRTSRFRGLVILAVPVICGSLFLAGCSKNKSVGSDDVLDFDEQKENRLGAASSTPEAQNPTPAAPAQNPAQPPAAPPPQQAPPPQAAETFFDVVLIDRHPYYQPGDQISIGRGTTLRVTNNDKTAERPERSFTADDGSFDSGMLKPGQVWTFKFDNPGSWGIVDRSAPFISAKLEVS